MCFFVIGVNKYKGAAARTEVVKIGEKTIGHRSRLMCLATQFLPEYSDADRADIVSMMMAPSGKVDIDVNKSVIMDALKHLEESDRKSFKDTIDSFEDNEREELITKRLEQMSRKDAEAATPEVVKELLPADKPPGARIVLDVCVNCFEAYYPKISASGEVQPDKKGYSISRSFVQKWTYEKALQQCVDFIFTHYFKHGGVAILAVGRVDASVVGSIAWVVTVSG